MGAEAAVMGAVVDQGQALAALVMNGEAACLNTCGGDRLGEPDGARGVDAVGSEGKEQALAADLPTGATLDDDWGITLPLERQGEGETADASAANDDARSGFGPCGWSGFM